MISKQDAKALGEANAAALWRSLTPIAIVWLAVGAVWEFTSIGYDDTDGSSRSGLTVKTDCLTGLQYLAGDMGGLTPRIGADGKQIR